MTKPSWTLKQTSFQDFSETDVVGSLEFRIQTGPTLFKDEVKLIDDAMRGNVPQGSFFAYLFRRFGYPERGWDNHKELVSYLLTTPRRDMRMRITPFANGTPDLGISFLVPLEVTRRCGDYPWRNVHAHRNALGDWVEQEGLIPVWIDKWRELLTQNPQMTLGAPPTTWKASLQHLWHLKYLNEQREEHPWYQWIVSTSAAYEAARPAPEPAYRNADWTRWSDSDPMKPYVAAAMMALKELHKAVWVRDCAITPWGPASDEEAGALERATYHKVSGYPSGALGNADPAGFAELIGQILELEETPEACIARASLLLAEAVKKES